MSAFAEALSANLDPASGACRDSISCRTSAALVSTSSGVSVRLQSPDRVPRVEGVPGSWRRLPGPVPVRPYLPRGRRRGRDVRGEGSTTSPPAGPSRHGRPDARGPGRRARASSPATVHGDVLRA